MNDEINLSPGGRLETFRTKFGEDLAMTMEFWYKGDSSTITGNFVVIKVGIPSFNNHRIKRKISLFSKFFLHPWGIWSTQTM